MNLFALALLLVSPKIDRDIVYSTADGKDQKLDIHFPVPAPTTPAPAIVLIHGGAWMSGDKKDMEQLATAMSSKGFLVANINYRLAPASKWPSMLDDSQTAVRYLRANASKLNIDPKRIGASGASAGGHLSLLLGFTETRDPKPVLYPGFSSKVSAVLDLFGPTDMSQDYPATLDSLYYMVLGKKKADAAAEIRSASPINFIDDKSAPVFIIQGTADPLVNIHQSKILEEKLKSVKRPVEAVYIEGMGHGGPKLTEKEGLDAIERGIEFLRKWLAS